MGFSCPVSRRQSTRVEGQNERQPTHPIPTRQNYPLVTRLRPLASPGNPAPNTRSNKPKASSDCYARPNVTPVRRFSLMPLPFLSLLTLLVCVAADSATAAVVNSSDAWRPAEEILARIKAPVFPARDFQVTDFGAIGDGRTDSRAAFARAIAACTEAGGGRVVVPAGVFLSDGPVHLASNVNLHISEGATLVFGADPARYLPAVLTRFEGTMLYGHSPRIYVRDATNVAITGRGTIDGNGRATLDLMKDSPGRGGSGTLRRMGGEGVPVEHRIFGEGKWLRPSMVQFLECTNVLVEGVTLKDSTFWVVHPVFCRNVTVRSITVESMNGNNDGCDPDSSTDVLIEDCIFRTGDDAIAIKSGRDQDGRQIGRPSENIVIRRVTMGSRHSGLCIGSEMSGGVRNVYMEDCTVETVSSALYFKSNLDRGGTVEHVRARRITVKSVRDGVIRFDTNYRAQDLRGGNTAPVFRDFLIEQVQCEEARSFGIKIEGLPGTPIRDVMIREVNIRKAATPVRIVETENVRLEAVMINGQSVPAP